MVFAVDNSNEVVTLPCGIEYVGKNGKGENKLSKLEESRTGILLLKTFQNKLLCYVLSTFTPNPSVIKGKTFLIFNDRNKNYIKAVLKLPEKYKILHGKPIIAWECSSFEKQQKAIFNPAKDWKLSSDEDKNRNESLKLSWFVLYQIDMNEISKMDLKMLKSHGSATCTDFHSLGTGQTVETRSYPFGPDIMEIFTSAMSTGVISNVSTDKSFFLVDARCLPGSEGGSVLTPDSNKLLGIIVAPLCWKNQELVGFAVCCSIRSVLSSLRNVLPPSSVYDDVNVMINWCLEDSKSPNQSQLIKGPIVVRVDVAGVWGSGVIVAASRNCDLYEIVIVTCRHVVEDAIGMNHVKIDVIFAGGERYTGKLLFASDEDSAYDVAILSVQVHPHEIEKLCLEDITENLDSIDGRRMYVVPYSKRFFKGSPVYIKGYPLFDTDIDLQATVCSGVLSNVLYNGNDSPTLLHSTCLVHKGSSGGGLICLKTNKLQGIVVNHVKDEVGKISYPDVNFSIPCNVFMPAIIEYLIHGRDLNSFNSELNCYDNEIVRAWNLEPLILGDKGNIKIKSKL